MFRLNRKAQSTLEYAILIFVVVAAILTMNIYLKRGLQGRLRASSDDIGEQFSPSYTGSNQTTTRDTESREQIGTNTVVATYGVGATKRDFIKDATTRIGTEKVGNVSAETFP
jgi:uncharacterized protein (UPF0333 family)